MDSNYVRIVDPDKPGDYLVLHTHDLKPTDVLFDEAVHGLEAVKTAEADRVAAENARAEAQRAAADSAKKAAEKPKPESKSEPAPAPVDAKGGKK